MIRLTYENAILRLTSLSIISVDQRAAIENQLLSSNASCVQFVGISNNEALGCGFIRITVIEFLPGGNLVNLGVCSLALNGGVAVPRFPEPEPPGWRELCAELRSEKDPSKVPALLDQINRLLTAFEKGQLHEAGGKRTTHAVPSGADEE